MRDCIYLDSATFMVFVFANAGQTNRFDFLRLRKMRDCVSSSLDEQNVYIEWTRKSVLGAIESFHDVFMRSDNGVAWRGKDKIYSKECFSVDFSKEFVDKLDGAVKEALKSTNKNDV